MKQAASRQKSTPRFSIVTVVLNDCMGLEKTLNSVAQQTLSSWEQVVIDGCSTDGTQQLIRQRHNQIDDWVSEPDEGIYDAMNKGLSRCSGDYVYFLNAGDYFCHNQVLKNVANYLAQVPVDLIYGRVKKKFKDFEDINHGRIEKIMFGQMPPHQASFVARHVLIKLDGFNTDYKSSGDFDFFCRLLKNGCSCRRVPDIIAYFMAGGMSSNRSIALRETYSIIKKHFGWHYAAWFYFERKILRLGRIKLAIKKMLVRLRLGFIVDWLVK